MQGSSWCSSKTGQTQLEHVQLSMSCTVLIMARHGLSLLLSASVYCFWSLSTSLCPCSNPSCLLSAEYKELFQEAIKSLKSQGGQQEEELDFSPFAATAKLLYESAFVAERYSGIRAFLDKDKVSHHFSFSDYYIYHYTSCNTVFFAILAQYSTRPTCATIYSARCTEHRFSLWGWPSSLSCCGFQHSSARQILLEKTSKAPVSRGWESQVWVFIAVRESLCRGLVWWQLVSGWAVGRWLLAVCWCISRPWAAGLRQSTPVVDL